jgi:signal transduction histidine kinase
VRDRCNTFLAALPETERQRILTLGNIVPVVAGEILHETGTTVRDVWFPIDCVASLSTALQNGSEAEVAIIGREGLVGVAALLGGTDTTWNEAAVQIQGTALRVPLDRMRHEVTRSGPLRPLLQRYAQALLVQTSQMAACNRFHSIEQRLARCLLAFHDRVGSGHISITHDRLAVVLGSLRPGVTLAAQHLQSEGIIQYTRGKMTVLDRAALAARACECYAAVSAEYERLMGPEALQQMSATDAYADEVLREVNGRLILAAIREQQAREAAEEVNDVTARFFATLSHELRTPLTAILGWADVLQSRQVNDETLKLAIDTIHRNAEAQKQLVNDMIELTRLRSSDLELRPQALDLTTAVRAAVDSIRPSADAKSIGLSVIAGDGVVVQADPLRVQQILTNLLANAVKFTPQGGSIDVQVTPTGGYVKISVRDSGRGIEPELLPRVFDEFHQGTAAASGELGMGLGLAIVRHLVNLHGGTVQAQSAGAGSGATFTVLLPNAGGGGGRLAEPARTTTPRARRGRPAGPVSTPFSRTRAR